MTRREKAVMIHKEGCNCAQSVLASCCDLAGIDEITARKIGAGLGSGLNCGEVCGAVNGAVILLSLKYPYTGGDQPEEKEKIIALTKKFAERFKEKYDTVRCDELVAAAEPLNLCNDYIMYAVEILEEFLENN